MPLLEFFSYKHLRNDLLQEFSIKKKDYGELVLYDIFYENTFLFTISHDGKVLLSNWEDARKEPVRMDDRLLGEISRYIVSLRQVPVTREHRS